MQSNEYTKLSLIKQINSYAIPICITNLLGIAASFFTTVMIAKVGKTELAALAIVNALYIPLTAFLGSILYSTSILISKHHANSNREMVSTYAWNSIWLSIILGFFGAIFLWESDKILALIGQPRELIVHTREYFVYASFGMIPLMLGSAIAQIYNGVGKAKIGTILTFLRLPLSIYFSYELILGHYHLCLAGAAIAFLLAQLIALLVAVIYTRFSQLSQHFQKNYRLFNWQYTKQLFKVGIHIGLQFLGELGAISVSTILMGYLGSTALASSQIVSQYSIILAMINLGISQALAIRTSEAYGSRQFNLVDKYFRSALTILIITFTIFALVYLLMPFQLISIFIDTHQLQNSDLINLTHYLLIITIPTMLFDGVKNLLTSSLRGLENSKAPMIIGNIGVWLIGIPACYLIGLALHGGPIGLRIGFALGFLAASIILWFYFKQYKTRFLGTNI